MCLASLSADGTGMPVQTFLPVRYPSGVTPKRVPILRGRYAFENPGDIDVAAQQAVASATGHIAHADCSVRSGSYTHPSGSVSGMEMGRGVRIADTRLHYRGGGDGVRSPCTALPYLPWLPSGATGASRSSSGGGARSHAGHARSGGLGSSEPGSASLRPGSPPVTGS